MVFKTGRIATILALVFICALASACGKGGYKYPGMSLAPDPTDPGSSAVYPQDNGKASITGKNLTFNPGGSEVPDYVFGGVSPDEGVTVSDNNVTVNGGEIAEHAYGGYSQEGKALNNTLTINDGKMLSAFAGGSRLDSSGNTLYLHGGALRIDRDGDSAFGGYAWGGKANNNKLVVSGGDLPGSIYGGWARSDSSTGNTVNFPASPISARPCTPVILTAPSLATTRTTSPATKSSSRTSRAKFPCCAMPNWSASIPPPRSSSLTPKT